MSQQRINELTFFMKNGGGHLELELEAVNDSTRKELESIVDKYSGRRFLPPSWQKDIDERVSGSDEKYYRAVEYFKDGDLIVSDGEIGGPYNRVGIFVKSAKRGWKILQEIMEMDLQTTPKVGKAIQTVREAMQLKSASHVNVRVS